jgi:D-methionine transport system ATP-binding protein
MSGAGKSTLVRCLNYLEKPDSGSVIVAGDDMGTLTETQLRAKRKDMGMIFQHFNLLMQKNAIGNVCFPLKLRGMSTAESKRRAREYLKIVGIEDKEKAYPAQLSGGEKQRVAIARALASDPKILLCDEATSALDTKTTSSILALLKEINEKYNITMVVITHQMSVVREICNKVAIIEKGELVETGSVDEVFAHPQSRAGKELVLRDSADGEVRSIFAAAQEEEMRSSRIIRIIFTENSSYEPVISNMVLEFGRPVNILGADTKNVSGTAKGEMILGLPEDENVARQMIDYLINRKLEVTEVIAND